MIETRLQDAVVACTSAHVALQALVADVGSSEAIELSDLLDTAADLENKLDRFVVRFRDGGPPSMRPRLAPSAHEEGPAPSMRPRLAPSAHEGSD